MARMIPDLDPGMITNDGERLFYEAARDLPPDYTVLHSYKYQIPAFDDGPDEFGEADFVVVHPALGYAVVEVKQGEVQYNDGVWYERKGNRTQPIAKDPAEQAKRAMFAILARYKEKAQSEWFPLTIKYAICFPESLKVVGDVPAHLDPASVLLNGDLAQLDAVLWRLFDAPERKPDRETTALLVERVLAPNFRAFARLDERIEMYDRAAARVLTEEQERILEETGLDKRKVFFGAAGSGKTFLAMEKARQLADSGRRVLLTCYNKDLAAYMRSGKHVGLPPNVTCANFHDHLLIALATAGFPLAEPSEDAAKQLFYEQTLPTAGFDHYCEAAAADKFDSIIVDEGQDFRADWLTCLETMLRDPDDGEFYVFADPNQDLFGVDLAHLHRLPISKHCLSRNLRNSETISNWLVPFVKEGSLKPVLRGGVPVVTHTWTSPDDERRQVEQEVGRLVSQGIRPQRILILSPNRREKSSFADRARVKEWPLEEYRQASAGAVRFATIRSFKGLEADIVLVIGLSMGNSSCTEADIYVGGSRARFILHLFCEQGREPECLGRGR